MQNNQVEIKIGESLQDANLSVTAASWKKTEKNDKQEARRGHKYENG